MSRIVDTESLAVDLQEHPEQDQGILGSAVVRGSADALPGYAPADAETVREIDYQSRRAPGGLRRPVPGGCS